MERYDPAGATIRKYFHRLPGIFFAEKQQLVICAPPDEAAAPQFRIGSWNLETCTTPNSTGDIPENTKDKRTLDRMEKVGAASFLHALPFVA